MNNQYGYYVTYGEVENKCGYGVDYVKVEASYYDEADQLMGTSYFFTELNILSQNQKSPFELSTYPEKYTPSRTSLEVSCSH